MLGSTKKRYPTSKSKGEVPKRPLLFGTSYQKEGRRGEKAFRIKPHSCQRCLEGSNKTLCIPGPRDPTETEPDPPLSAWMSSVVVRVSTGLLQGQGLWVQQTWIIQHVAKALLEEVAINPTTELLSRRPTNCRTIIPNKFSHC